MQTMSKNAEEVVRLLTQLADGDVALVRQVLIEHKGDDATKIIAHIRNAIQKRNAAFEVSSPPS